MTHIPALNELGAQVSDTLRLYPKDADEKRYMFLYPDDHHGFTSDVAGNIGILLDEENAREVKRLAESIISDLE